MSLVSNELTEYLIDLQPDCNGVLGDIQRESLEEDVPIIPKDVVRFLSFLLSVKKPKKILEIGTAVGFSSSLMASFLKKEGRIDTIDRFDVMIEQAKENIIRTEQTEKINIIKGQAVEVVKKLDEEYDVIFLDGAKGQYIQMLPDLLRLLKTGGILICDDVLQNGDIAKDRLSVERRQRTIHKRLRDFLWEITHNPLLESAVLTIGDGVAVCHKTGKE